MSDKDFVVKNGLVVNTNLIYANSTTVRVGIGNSSPDATLTVTGSANVQGNVAITLGTLLSNTLGVTGATTLSNTLSVTGTATFTTANVGANVQITSSQYYIGNSTSNVVVNSSVVAIGNSSVSATVNSTIYSGTANNVTYVGSVPAINVVSNAQLSSNLASYALLSGGLFTGSVNATSHLVGTIGAANGFLANSTTIAVGNSSVNTVIIGGSITTPVVLTPQINVGANVSMSISNVAVANGSYSNVTINSANIYIGNTTTSATINSTAYTGSANNATYFAGQSISQVVNTSANYTLSGIITFNANTTHSANIILGNAVQIGANGATNTGTAGYVLTSGGGTSNVYWSALPLSVNTSGSTGAIQFYNGSTLGSTAGLVFTAASNTITLGNSSVNSSINSTAFTGSANNATYLNGNLASNFVNTSGSFTFNGALTANGGLTVNSNFTISNSISANGSVGTSGYVLTSQGTGANVIWTPAVNTSAQFTFANTITIATTGGLTVNSNFSIANTIAANNSSVGTAGQVLTSGGSSSNVYWAAIPKSADTTGGAGAVQYNNGSGALLSCTALYFTGSGNNLTVGNTLGAAYANLSSGLFVGVIGASSNGITANTTTITIGNSTVAATINSTSYSGTITSFNNQPASYYTNASNITTGTLPYAQLGSAVVNTSANFSLNGVLGFYGNTAFNANTNYNANVAFLSGVNLGLSVYANGAGNTGTAGQALLSGGGTSNVYWGVAGVNTAAQYTFSNTITHSGPTVFSNTITANGSVGTSGQALLSNGATGSPYWGAAGVNTTAQYTFSNTITFSNTTTFSTVITMPAGTTNTSGIYPTSNTAGMNFGNTIARWIITGNSASLSGSLGVGTAASGTTGEIRAAGEVTAYYSSDKNLKINITPIENALDKIDLLTGVMFDWKDEVIETRGGEDGFFVRKHDTGVIAQEVEAVLPEVVATREDGFKAVKYEKLVGLLIEGIKQLRREIEELK